MSQTIPAASKPRTSSATNFIVAAGVVLFLGGALLAAVFPAQAGSAYHWTSALRWMGIAAIAAAGFKRSTLTYWIFFSLLLGVEIGLDRPVLAEHLRVLSDIFLRLIKVIVAPLIFGTLVTGIAGHGNLRSV